MEDLNIQRRDGKIELLRVLAMVMVLVLYYLYDNIGGVFGKLSSADGVNYYLAWFLESCCYVAVDVFVIISGYFLSTAKKCKLGKAISLVLQCLIYSIVIYIIGCVCDWADFCFPTLVTAVLMPLSSGKWWFVACYLVMYVLCPYLNAWHNALDKQQHKKMLILSGTIFVIIPSVIFWSGNTIGVNGGYCLIWFVYLYMLAAYLRKYSNDWSMRAYPGDGFTWPPAA